MLEMQTALQFQGLSSALSSPASRDAVKVGPSTHSLPGEIGLRVGLHEFKARQTQGPGATCCPSKWHWSSVKAEFSSGFVYRSGLGSLFLTYGNVE